MTKKELYYYTKNRYSGETPEEAKIRLQKKRNRINKKHDRK